MARRGHRVRVTLQAGVAIAALLLVAGLLFVPSVAPWLLRFEHWTADWRTAYLSPRAAGQHPQIALIAINDETLKDYVSSPIDRGLLARIVAGIDACEPAAIGIDIFFLKKTDSEKDEALIAALRQAKAPIVLGAIDERGELKDFQRTFQAEFIKRAGRPAGYLNLRHERDDVVRYTASPMPGGAYQKSFARSLAEVVRPGVTSDAGQPIPWRLPPADGVETFFKRPAQELLAPNFAGCPELQHRIAIIGGDFPLRDRHRTPLTVRDDRTVPGVEIHAQVLAGLLDGARSVHELAPIPAQLLLAAVALLGFGIGWLLWRSPVVGFLGSGFATALLVLADALCFTEYHLLLPFTLALVAWVAGLTAGRFLRPAAGGR